MADEALWTPDQGSIPSAMKSALAAQAASDDPAIHEMRLNRQAAIGSGVQTLQFATGRSKDPMFYWRQNNLPFNVWDDKQLAQLREYCRLVYLTHPVMASAIDVYSKYPLTGMEIRVKDPSLQEFYEELFFDQLDYDEFFVDIGREHWTVGEAWPLGSFNETLGVWEDDELINPDDVQVTQSPFQKEPRYEMKLPQTIREIIKSRQPAWEYEALMRSYPELARFQDEDALMPVSSILLRQLRFRADSFNPRGVPILMRAIRYLVQEEMLNAAMDSIADRLYTPLILARLGASANELGTNQPWIPTAGDRQDFLNSLDAALAGDFRILVHHFAVQMDNVFGREMMPRFEQDFERIQERELQTFGLSKTLLTGAGANQTYAGDALNRDLVTQLLTRWQRQLHRFFQHRAAVVAEAQEHYDYEVRGGRRVPIMEEKLELDEETGEQYIVEQPKLLIPDIKFKVMNLAQEAEERAFIEALRAEGIPISDRTRLTNVPIDFDEEVERVREEQVQKAIEAQITRKAVYQELSRQGLPIPEDLRADFEPHAQVEGAQGPMEPGVIPLIGRDQPMDMAALVPPPAGEEQQQEDGDPGVEVLPRSHWLPEMGSSRPPESDEARGQMPKPLSTRIDAAALRDSGAVDARAGGLQFGPLHVGMRRYASVSRDTDLDEYRDRRRREAVAASEERESVLSEQG